MTQRSNTRPLAQKGMAQKARPKRSCPKTRVKKPLEQWTAGKAPRFMMAFMPSAIRTLNSALPELVGGPVTEFAIEVAFRSRAIRKLPMIAKRLVVPARSKRASDGCYPSLPFLQQGGRKSDHQFRPVAMKRWVMRVTARKGFRNVKTIGWISHYGFSFRLR